ncbi:hypothetical protein HJG60_011019 [Phyllostomus discolor]|uniref:Uncharacterized protein n=1 Tax=Phyllostomus discolor TaxID=89673 RepID=A0A834AF28_9CHIR|nr:hypothetical protein HJG60_011019 [Phyllostomus discolor]
MDVGSRCSEGTTSIYLPLLHTRRWGSARAACMRRQGAWPQRGACRLRRVVPTLTLASRCSWPKSSPALLPKHISRHPGQAGVKGRLWVTAGTVPGTAGKAEGRSLPPPVCSWLPSGLCAGSGPAWAARPRGSCLRSALVLMRESLERVSPGIFIFEVNEVFKGKPASKAKY